MTSGQACADTKPKWQSGVAWPEELPPTGPATRPHCLRRSAWAQRKGSSRAGFQGCSPPLPGASSGPAQGPSAGEHKYRKQTPVLGCKTENGELGVRLPRLLELLDHTGPYSPHPPAPQLSWGGLRGVTLGVRKEQLIHSGAPHLVRLTAHFICDPRMNRPTEVHSLLTWLSGGAMLGGAGEPCLWGAVWGTAGVRQACVCTLPSVPTPGRPSAVSSGPPSALAVISGLQTPANLPGMPISWNKSPSHPHCQKPSSLRAAP